MALFGISNYNNAPSTVVSVEPIRGEVHQELLQWQQQVGNNEDGTPYYLNHSYLARFFATGAVTTSVYTGLNKDGAIALANSLTKQDDYAVATGGYGCQYPYVARAERASVRRVAGRMYEVTLVVEERTCSDINLRS